MNALGRLLRPQWLDRLPPMVRVSLFLVPTLLIWGWMHLPDRQPEPDWQFFTDSSQSWQIEAPGELVFQHLQGPTGLPVEMALIELGRDGYSVSKSPVPTPPGATGLDLDAGADGSIDSILEGVRRRGCTNLTTSPRHVSTGTVAGVEGRRFSITIHCDGNEISLDAVLFVREDQVVVVMAIDSMPDDQAVTGRFLGSLKAT